MISSWVSVAADNVRAVLYVVRPDQDNHTIMDDLFIILDELYVRNAYLM